MSKPRLALEGAPTIDFAAYAARGDDRSPVKVLLRASDFSRGTLRIRTGNAYFLLTENVDLEPGKAPEFKPDDDVAYPSPPYQLGFFAGITVETEDPVTIDLGGFRIRQSAAFALQQRFFAVIELGSAPFLPGQGPSRFEEHTRCAHVTVCNGHIGRSSHHAIHGLDCQDVVLENLVLCNFEVCGVQINGGRKITCRNTCVGPAFTRVPVRATYSQARFVRPFLRAAMGPGKTLNGVSGETILARLEAALATTFANVVAGRAADHGAPECVVFANPSGLTDGSGYGMVFNTRGVFVNGFHMERPADAVNHDITLENVEIQGVRTRTDEWVGLCTGTTPEVCYGGGGYQTGPVGDVFRIAEVTSSAGDSDIRKLYSGDVLSDAQLFVAKHMPGAGTSRIQPATVDWAEGRRDSPGAPLRFNGDCMAHVCKGNAGIVFQSAVGVRASHVRVSDVAQTSDPGKGPAYETSHPLQTKPLGYGGATSRGIAVVSCADVVLHEVQIARVRSRFADCAGIDMIGTNDNIMTNRVRVTDLRPGDEGEDGAPTPIAVGCPVRRSDRTNSQHLNQPPPVLESPNLA